MSVIDHDINELKASCAGGMWEDPDFELSQREIFGKEDGDMDSIELKRIGELSDAPELFVGGVDCGDIKQGEVGDCWFLSALAVIAERIDLLKQVVFAEAPENGIYQFRFWKNGEWRVVTVDDRLVVNKDSGMLRFAHCESANEFWVPLLEKAYAKLHGGYQRLNKGYMGYAFSDMTGGCPEQFQWRTDAALFDDGTIEAKLRQAEAEGWLMGCSWQTEKATGDQKNGLISNHAYSILRVVDASNDEVMVNLRNPWGEGEWDGDYSDRSDKWTDDLKEELGWTDDDDGSFWMTMADFGANFNKIMTCRLYHDGEGEMWSRYVHAGEWTDESDGGSLNDHDAWKKNPQYEVVFEEQSSFYATLCQDDRRMEGRPHEEYFHIALRLYQPGDEHFVDGPILKPKDSGDEDKSADAEEDVIQDGGEGSAEDEEKSAGGEDENDAEVEKSAGDGEEGGGASGEPTRRMQRGCHETVGEKFKFLNSRDVGMEAVDVEPGKYVLVPATFEGGKTGSYVLQVFTQKPASITYLAAGGEEEVELEETPMPASENADKMDDDM